VLVNGHTAKEQTRPARLKVTPMAEETGTEHHPPDLVDSVRRALRVLEVVADHPDGIQAKAVARRLGMPLSTTYHLLNTLVAEGYLLHLEEARGYGLGYKIPMLDRSLRHKLAVSPALTAALDQVHQRAHAAAYYAVFRDADIVVAHVADAPQTPRVDPLDVGFNDAAHALAFGKVMLASMSASDRQQYLEEHGLPAFTEQTTTDEPELDVELKEVADRGLGLDLEEFRPGLACVATPVLAVDGTVLGSVAVSVPATSFERAQPRLAAAVRQGAVRIGRALALQH
jgi:DNA-binding IclR family transcriptional regulator